MFRLVRLFFLSVAPLEKYTSLTFYQSQNHLKYLHFLRKSRRNICGDQWYIYPACTVCPFVKQYSLVQKTQCFPWDTQTTCSSMYISGQYCSGYVLWPLLTYVLPLFVDASGQYGEGQSGSALMWSLRHFENPIGCWQIA